MSLQFVLLRTADLQILMARAFAWITAANGGIALAIDVVVVGISLFAPLFVARFIRRIARRFVDRVPNLSKLLQVFLVGLGYWIVLPVSGVDISPVFALIGGASFILAFAFQDTLGNLASGLMIRINRPFDECDYVDIGSIAGTVRAVSIVAKSVTTPDQPVIVILNKNVWGNAISNVTTSETRHVNWAFDDAGISIPFAQQDLHIRDVAAIQTNPTPPQKPTSNKPDQVAAKRAEAPRDVASAMAQGNG